MSTAPTVAALPVGNDPHAGASPGESRMAVDVTTFTPRYRARWDRYVRAHRLGTFFHTIAWQESVQEAFGHRPHHGLAIRDGEVIGVLPLFEVRSLLAGTMLVSVPYAVAGGPLVDTSSARDALWRLARATAVEVGARSIELRSQVRQFDNLKPVDHYVVFKRELPATAQEVLAWLPRKARAAARNARTRHGLTTEFGDHYLPAVWKLYCRSMRRLASLCYPYRFFETLLERNRSDTHVQVVFSGDRIIAGLMSFRFGGAFVPYFVGCDERFNRMNTNHFLYMTAMQRAVELGCREFDFGRTRLDNKGSYDFKRFCGFVPQPLGYQRYVPDGGRAPDLTPSNPRFRLARRVWRHLPAAVCVRLGTWASGHIPG